MWTAHITNVTKDKGEIIFVVRYLNKEREFDKYYKSSQAPNEYWLERQVEKQLQLLEDIDAVPIDIGPVAKPPVQPPPEPQDPKLIEFETRRKKASRIIDLLTIGALSKDDPRVTELAAALATDLETYWGEL